MASEQLFKSLFCDPSLPRLPSNERHYMHWACRRDRGVVIRQLARNKTDFLSTIIHLRSYVAAPRGVNSMSDSHGAQKMHRDWPKQIQNAFPTDPFLLYPIRGSRSPGVQTFRDWFQTPMHTVAETPGIHHQYHHCMSATECQQLTRSRTSIRWQIRHQWVWSNHNWSQRLWNNVAFFYVLPGPV